MKRNIIKDAAKIKTVSGYYEQPYVNKYKNNKMENILRKM